MTETTMGGKVAVGAGRLVLLRHGQTAWSESGQHTGRTNIPLTAEGERQAKAAGERLREAFPEGFAAGHVFASPLRRARQTAALAGFDVEPGDDGVIGTAGARLASTLADLPEWDYGRAEGRTRETVCRTAGFDWDVWRDGPQTLPASMDGDWRETLPSGETVSVHAGQGERVEDVAERTRRVIERVSPMLCEGEDVLLVAHAHVLRILTSQWLGLDPRFARLLRLDTAHYAVLGGYKGDRVIITWNR